MLKWAHAEEDLLRLANELRHHPSKRIRSWFSTASTKARDVIISGNGGVELRPIPAGEFLMGSNNADADERPQRRVRIAAFAIGRYPVTNEEYGRFLKANSKHHEPMYWSDRRFNSPRQPVVGVSWDEAQAFAEWAGGRLPSEAQWEYAARGGMQSAYWWGDEPDPARANYDGSDSEWGGKSTSPVGSFEANPFGLFDTAGNVWEWVADCWHGSYEGAPDDGGVWGEEGGGDCERRVIRGGAWDLIAWTMRSSNRYWNRQGNRYVNVGFRLAQDI